MRPLACDPLVAGRTLLINSGSFLGLGVWLKETTLQPSTHLMYLDLFGCLDAEVLCVIVSSVGFNTAESNQTQRTEKSF